MAAIRAIAARSHASTCRLYDPPSGRTPGGGNAPGTYLQTGPPVPCRVDPGGRQAVEQVFGGRVQGQVDYVVAFPPGTAVKGKQRVGVGGETLEVIAATDLGTYQAEVYAACTDID